MSRREDPNRLRGRNALLLGLGARQGGLGVARYLVASGTNVRVTDLREAAQLRDALDALGGLPVQYTLGRHTESDFDWADVVVRNPAVPAESRWLAYARARGKRVEMEMTLFLRACPAPVIGVTGTKGKTTTTTLLHAMLRERWPSAALAGNMGRSAVEQLPELTVDVPVALELSSFQLEGLDEHQLAPRVAVVTNVSADHLDRYADFEAYAAVKASIARWQTPDDWLVVPRGGWLPRFDGSARRATFGRDETDGDNALWLAHGRFMGRWDGAEVDLGRVDALRVPGEHSRLNALAAAAAALACGVAPDDIARAIASFNGVPNRLEHVASVGGVAYVNDTAATTPAAALAAMAAYAGRELVVIAGGSDKRLDLAPLADGLARYASRVLLLDGSATATLAELLRARDVRTLEGPFSGMATAVQAAQAMAHPGGVVLLSPGCASFGLFRDEFDRGDQFRAAVRRLADGASGGNAQPAPAATDTEGRT
jgi:UDP-N-acetylmuramoylalanine--D-glutamate ligase